MVKGTDADATGQEATGDYSPSDRTATYVARSLSPSADHSATDGSAIASVRIGRGRSYSSEADLTQLLRQRLFFFSLGGSLFQFILIGVAVALGEPGISNAAALFTLPPCYGVGGIMALVLGVAAITLSRRKSWSLAALRRLEWPLLGVPVLCFVWNGMLNLMACLPELRSGENRLTLASSDALPFVFLIVLYGAFIPNTWRRCAAGVVLLGTTLVLSRVWVVVSGGVPPQHATVYLVSMTCWLIASAAVVVFGANRVEQLRQDVAEARQLGQYRLRQPLGAGGMGQVYLADHALLKRPCAVKLIRPDRAAADPAVLARFEREVQATASLAHPNVIRIHDYGRAEDGTFYCVMEYLPGVNLEALVRQHGPLPPERVVFLLRQLCAALGEAHAAGLTHRDVKPGNVIVRDGGRQADFATLLDFGLVLDRATASDKLTTEGAVAGTPAFMSPEQAAGDPVDHRADLYAVGAVGYFLLSGRPPFAAGSAMRTLAAVLTEPAPPLSNVPAALGAAIGRCMAKTPADRYATADALDAALAGCEDNGWCNQKALEWWRNSAEPAGNSTRR